MQFSALFCAVACVAYVSMCARPYSPIRVFSLFCPVFCPFVDVACVARLLSAVTGLTVHPLSLSFEGKDKVVMGYPLGRFGWRHQQPSVGGLTSLQRAVCSWLLSELEV